MKIKTGKIHDPVPIGGRCMTAEEMNPGSLYLREGQELMVYERDYEEKKKRKKYIKIIRLYQHHAMCRVNGRNRECFTYNELYTMMAERGMIS